MHVKLILFFLIVYQNLLKADGCEKHKTCHDCITDPSPCIWCMSTEKQFDTEPRCISARSYETPWCLNSTYVPEVRSPVANKNREFSSTEGDEVQIKPQSYNVEIRPGQPVDFTFSFTGAKNYPVDLYMLLDASDTMSNVRKNISTYSEQIYTSLQNMTKNVKFGYGTFVDKNTPPFTTHWLNLTADYKKFKETVTHTKSGRNTDIPEGGFDALAQVMVCRKFGWREKSRKIVVFFTDSPQHVVGDGQAAGIFKPFDGNCHTNEMGVYTEELEMDYPSLTQLNCLAIKYEFTIIFALKERTADQVTLYGLLKKIISGSRVAILENNDIVEQLTKTYKEISTHIKFEVPLPSDQQNIYNIKFNPDCTQDDNSDCKFETGKNRNFTGTIILDKYYNGQDSDTIDISIQGTNEKFTLNVKVIKCSCEADEVFNSPHCNNQKLQCGACICDESTYGHRCMCTKNKPGDSRDSEDSCIAPWDSASVVCSGPERGKCHCGKCECIEETQHGGFCECDYTNCPGHADGKLCGGHGTCKCGAAVGGRRETCMCDEGWILNPEAEYLGCMCRNSTESCMTDTTICNNRGNCICDACKCNAIAQWDKRIEQDPLCVVKPCPECHSMQCGVVRACVLCRMDSENCEEHCQGIAIENKYDVLPNEYLKSNEWSLCDQQKVNMGCYTKFLYKYDDKKYRILLLMQQDKYCAESYYMYGGILLGSLLSIGILTIVAWKCLTHYQDLREYNKFVTEHASDLDCTSNPLYLKPVTIFENPAFNKSIN